jgi:hypothetical protein
MPFNITLNIDLMNKKDISNAIAFLGPYLGVEEVKVTATASAETIKVSEPVTNTHTTPIPAEPEVHCTGHVDYAAEKPTPKVRKTRAKKINLADEIVAIVVEKMNAGDMTPDDWKLLLNGRALTQLNPEELAELRDKL